jgi:hypothetical protein
MNTKRNVFNFIIAIMLIGGLTNCEDQLTPVIYSDLTPEIFYKTPEDFNNAVVSLYNAFLTDWGTTDIGDGMWYTSLYNCDRKSYWCRSMLTTDELYLNPSWDPNLVNFTWGPSTYSGGEEPTYPKVRYIARATGIIDQIEKSTTVNENIKMQFLAEAKVLRAWLMYVVYDFFGPVPVRIDPYKLTDTTILPRPTKEEYCAQIEKDLTDALAIPNATFPEAYNNDQTNWGRVSKGVARMLLLKLYMHNRQWDKAETIANEIVSMNYYSLLPDYTEVFNKMRNKELIYSVPCNSSNPNWWLAPLFPGNFKAAKLGNDSIKLEINGWYGFWMPWSFYEKFDTNDTRRNTTIISSYVNNKGKKITKTSSPALQGPIPMKYTKPIGEKGPSFFMDLVVFRYAEVLLSLAEAINEQRGPADAFQYVNQVRNRAGLTSPSKVWNITNIPTKEAFRDSILVERGRELYCEGQRRQDLVRHGKYIQYAIDRGATGATPGDTLFPIPINVIIEGRGIVIQNPGYEN